MLKKKGVPHHVLNAKYHEKEAQIVAQAGKKGTVTIATNMAGRGTDIILGGNPPDPKEHDEVVKLGGLHIVGTERHEARRIDNQLRGRAGRQGDPGSSRFYISLEDDLMRIFGSDRIKGMMGRLGMEEGQEIQHPWITKAIERAQSQVEAHNFEIRKHLLEYDDVMNQQRQVIYQERDMVLYEEDISDRIEEMIEEVTSDLVETYASKEVYPDDWNLKGLVTRFGEVFGSCPLDEKDLMELNHEELEERLITKTKELYRLRREKIEERQFCEIERMILLHVIDSLWKDHLYSMDTLKEGIGLRGYGQRDPLVEYKHESYHMFQDLIWRIKEMVVSYIFKVQINQDEERSYLGMVQEKRASSGPEPVYARKRKIGRNDPCPCGSGKKYKRCCGE